MICCGTEGSKPDCSWFPKQKEGEEEEVAATPQIVSAKEDTKA